MQVFEGCAFWNNLRLNCFRVEAQGKKWSQFRQNHFYKRN